MEQETSTLVPSLDNRNREKKRERERKRRRERKEKGEAQTHGAVFDSYKDKEGAFQAVTSVDEDRRKRQKGQS